MLIRLGHNSKSKTPAARQDAPDPATVPRPVGWHDRWTVLGVGLFLAGIVWMVFGQTRHYAFVNFDDKMYVYENPEVVRGLTLRGILWAFTHVHGGNWHPLTGMSHMLDCQFYGLNAGGHHLTNVVLQAAAAILLFLVLRNLTGCLWRSAWVAAVFAIHPLRVESVAWISERKDVLSGVFFMLTVGAYARYARNPWSPARYGLVVLLFALGLMCKPMLVTLPFVLLLLDYWPLNRWRAAIRQPPVFRLGGWLVPRRLMLEKLPLLGLAAAAGVATLLAQTEAINSFDQVPLPYRAGNALIACAIYVRQMFWPSGLTILIPYPANGWPAGEVLLAAVLLLFVTAGVFGLRNKHPCLLVGWLWYLVMLAPVIGLLQVGAAARADRYTYLPQIGLVFLLAWAVADLCAGWRHRRWLLGGGATVGLAALILCAHRQTAYWRDSESLWTRSLACTTDNIMAYTGLGDALLQQGRVDEAITQYQTALRIKADFAEAHNSLGGALLQKGMTGEAIRHYQQALQTNPNYLGALNNLAWVLSACPEAAWRNGQRAVDLARRANQLARGDNPLVLGGLAAAYAEAGRFPEAVATAQRACQLAQAQSNLGLAEALHSELMLYQAGQPFRIN